MDIKESEKKLKKLLTSSRVLGYKGIVVKGNRKEKLQLRRF